MQIDLLMAEVKHDLPFNVNRPDVAEVKHDLEC